jgi:hypothetical protein
LSFSVFGWVGGGFLEPSTGWVGEEVGGGGGEECFIKEWVGGCFLESSPWSVTLDIISGTPGDGLDTARRPAQADPRQALRCLWGRAGCRRRHSDAQAGPGQQARAGFELQGLCQGDAWVDEQKGSCGRLQVVRGHARVMSFLVFGGESGPCARSLKCIRAGICWG